MPSARRVSAFIGFALTPNPAFGGHGGGGFHGGGGGGGFHGGGGGFHGGGFGGAYNNAPPYDPNASYDDDSRASYVITPTPDPAALHFDLKGGAGQGDNSSDQNGQPPQPEVVPNGPAPAAPAQTRLVSQPQT